MKDFLKLLKIPSGRWKIFLRPEYDKLWPLLSRLAWGYRRFFLSKTCVVAIVGSLGKTTTRHILNRVLATPDRRQSYSNYRSSLAENLLRTSVSDSCVVLEAGVSGPGMMSSYAKMLEPNIVVVTSIKSEHNRSFPSLEHTRKEKVKMITSLSPLAYAVLNGDDPNVRWMATQTRARIKTYGMNPDNEIYATEVQIDWPHGTRFKIHVEGKTQEVFLPLHGSHRVYSALAAVVVGLIRGVSLDEIILRLATVTPIVSRLELISLPNGVILVDDSYKASIESVHAALDFFLQIPAKRRVLVMGSVEEPPSSQGPIYRELGKKIANKVGRMICIGTESFLMLRGAASRAGMDKSLITFVGSRIEPAIDILKSELTAGDVALLKGASARKLRRIALSLIGKNVSCSEKFCGVKVACCDLCPLLEGKKEDFENRYIRRFLKA